MGLTIAKPNRERYYGDVQILDFDDTLSSCPGKITLPVELIIRESTRNLSCLHF